MAGVDGGAPLTLVPLGLAPMAFVAAHPRNIPATYHKPIGELLVRWSVAELYIQSVTWHVWGIKDPKAARLLTWDLQAASKVDLFRQLSPRWITDATLSSELRALAAGAERLRVKRNRVAHGNWGHKAGDRKTLYLMNASRDKRILPTAERITPQDVKTWATELDALNRMLIAFHKKLGAPTP